MVPARVVLLPFNPSLRLSLGGSAAIISYMLMLIMIMPSASYPVKSKRFFKNDIAAFGFSSRAKRLTVAAKALMSLMLVGQNCPGTGFIELFPPAKDSGA